MPVVEQLRQQLAETVRVKVDDREETPGFKFNDWEMRGVPLRIEVGPKDVEKGTVVFARRDVPGKEGKSFVPQAGIAGSSPIGLGDDPGGYAEARHRVPRCQHARTEILRRVQVDRGRRFRARVVVRRTAVRGRDQRRDESDHALHSAGAAGRIGRVCPLRQAGE